MASLLAAALPLLLGADLAVPAGAPLAEAVARLAPGDTLRLGPGEHRGALGRLRDVRVAGAGAGVTVLVAPQGVDGAVAEGPLALEGLSIVAGPHRSALKVLGGSATLHDVALVGGAVGAYVGSGRLEGREVVLDGGYGLLCAGGEVALTGVTAWGRQAAVGVIGGDVRLERAALTGPSSEAAISVAGGQVRLVTAVVRDPGPTGISVMRGTLTASDLTLAGPRLARGLDAEGGFPGGCAQVRRGELRLVASELVACGGAALEASRARVWLDGVDAAGGEAGCLIFTDRSEADLSATLCTRRGPGLVAMEGSTVRAFGARFWTDPALWVDCGSGARVVELDRPGVRQPCTPAPAPNP